MWGGHSCPPMSGSPLTRVPHPLRVLCARSGKQRGRSRRSRPFNKKREGMASAMPKTSSHKMNCHPERSEEPALSLSKGPMQLAVEGTAQCSEFARVGRTLLSANDRITTDAGAPPLARSVRKEWEAAFCGSYQGIASAMPRTSSHKMNCHPERSEEPALSLSKGPMQLAAEGMISTRKRTSHNWAFTTTGAAWARTARAQL
jgi:hypothetical protein